MKKWRKKLVVSCFFLVVAFLVFAMPKKAYAVTHFDYSTTTTAIEEDTDTEEPTIMIVILSSLATSFLIGIIFLTIEKNKKSMEIIDERRRYEERIRTLYDKLSGALDENKKLQSWKGHALEIDPDMEQKVKKLMLSKGIIPKKY